MKGLGGFPQGLQALSALLSAWAQDDRGERMVVGARLATGLVSMAVLVGCQREADRPPLPQVALNAAQTEALQQMNVAGRTAFAGWTWRYEFGAGCTLRVIRRYEDRPIPMVEHVLIDHVVDLVPYPGSGFGVKAHPRAKPGSADLFDARSEVQAKDFAADVQRLLSACGSPPVSSRRVQLTAAAVLDRD